ncbi:DUF6916 family protein [Roseicyclus mahoneyensis]|uniref:DUF6916 domain-containing protein n=1 Tax=Roseicyclus mahoneyensis TaxID=164332 RepID=A0A316GZT0_9RHOB|nr:hypothetical protein [Roseicyclus mahoneyensis]PWK60649.1 hypothetical protein C7455_104286 [Roseicyclus mahoneyensis]
MTIDLVTATADSFRPHIGQDFTVNSVAGPLVLRLDNIKIFEGSTVRDNHLEIGGVVYPPRKAFALTLIGPREPVLRPGLMALSYPHIGPLTLFVSPFRQDHDCTLYEAVFN